MIGDGGPYPDGSQSLAIGLVVIRATGNSLHANHRDDYFNDS